MQRPTLDDATAPSRKRLRKTTPWKRLEETHSPSSDVEIVNCPARTSSAVQAEHFGLRHEVFQRMRKFQMPFVFFNLMWLVCRRTDAENHAPVVDNIEWLSGVQSVVRGVTSHGYCALGYDTCNAGWEDFISIGGMITALVWLRRCVRRAGDHWATQCCTFVWMSRSSTLRSDAQPMGLHPRSTCVENAQQQVSLMVIYISIWVAAHHGFWSNLPVHS